MKILKSTLKHSNNTDSYNQKINYILRELYYRISRRRNKSATLYSILYYDLLETSVENSNNILTNLLNNKETSLRMLKLLNALTNENFGRTYLLKKKTVIEEIVKLMIKQVSY